MLRVPSLHFRSAPLLLPLASACTTLPAPQVPAPSTSNSPFVAFDIDGTLTPHNLLLLEPRPDAATVVSAFESKGYAIVYITMRVPGLQSSLPLWLKKHGFPAGNLHVPESSEERENAADFKLRVLSAYIAAGWRLSYAFGDSASDFVAYQRAGLPKDRVFALKRKGRSTCEEGVYGACLAGWAEYLEIVSIAPEMAN
jgi:phosphatidate phosphatase PAH1